MSNEEDLGGSEFFWEEVQKELRKVCPEGMSVLDMVRHLVEEVVYLRDRVDDLEIEINYLQDSQAHDKND